MTDIICPVCGQTNAVEAEECRSCKAPLKTTAFTPDFADESSLPEWLQQLSADQPASPGDEAVQDQAGFPDWLRQISKEEGLELPSDIEGEIDTERSELQADLLPQEGAQPETSDQQDWMSGWMEEIQAATKPESEEQAEDVQASEMLESAPQADASQAELQSEEQSLAALPDWAAEISSEPSESDELAQDQPDLEPAELPSWLEAMRPSEEEVPSFPTEDVSKAAVEGSGPLIGLRGVLSSEPVNIKAQKTAYSLKLRVTDEQKQRVALLQQLLADEPKPKALPAPPVITAGYLFRLLIALVLLFPVVWMIANDGQRVPLPERSTMPGVLAAYQLVERMEAGKPVMVAFDYEAGFSGEMDAAASAFIEHLMSRHAYLTLVSTSATGPALAERFISTLNQNSSHLDQTYTAYTNFGYIPGGSIGLHSLVGSLRQTLPYDLQGVDIWAGEDLRNVIQLTDFGMLVILVNDPEIARAWIEQTATILNQNGIPLVMVTSAQAAPLVQPYFAAEPQQVQGLVVGMAGGAVYEDTLASSGPARRSWDAYSLGLIASVFVILAGAALEMMVKAFGVEKERKQELR